jgi:hypothetical protein
MSSIELQHQIESLPEGLRKEVENFVQFLIAKSKKSGKDIPLKDLEGIAKGKIHMSDDFDEPLEDFKEYME